MPSLRFQSTPPRRWWLRESVVFYRSFYISIHTTTQVVTYTHAGTGLLLDISIHTTTQVVTQENGWRWKSWLIFQSTPPRRWWQQIYTTIHTYIRQFSYKSFTATTYHLQTLQIHPKNTNYSWFPRCEPPRGFMGTSHSHGRIWKLKVIQNICFTPPPIYGFYHCKSPPA